MRGAALLGLCWSIAGCASAPVETDGPRAPDPVANAGYDEHVAVGVELPMSVGTSIGASFAWDLGDGRRVDGTHILASWDEPGNYTVVLIATQEDGRRATDARVVSVFEESAARPAWHSGAWQLASDGEVWGIEADAGVVFHLARDGTATRYVAGCDEPRAIDPGGEVTCANGDVWYPVGTRGEAVRGPVITRLRDAVATPLEVRVEAGAVDAPDVHALADDGRGGRWALRFRAGPDAPGTTLTELGSGRIIALDRQTGPDSDTGNRGVPNLTRALAISPSGKRAYVGGLVANDRAGHVRDGTDLTPETTVRAMIRAYDLSSGEQLAHKFPDNQDVISAIALDPFGTWLWAASPGTHKIVRYDAFTLDIAGSISDAGAGIDAIAVSADGLTLWVHAALDRELRAYDLSRPATPTLRGTWSTVDEEPLPADVLLGKRLFHESRDPRLSKDGYVTCASCHPDGDHDGRTWDFTQRGEGLRNTISLLGRAGTGMGPVHWTANFDEIQDFENDIRNGQGGLGLLSEADFAETSDPLGPPKAGRSPELDALAAYVTSLDTTPPSPWTPPPDGESMLAAYGCVTCHSPPAWTDSGTARHDVGTFGAGSGQRRGGPLDGLDTPTLLGTWATAPYLHDGSAPTLEVAIERHVPGLDPEVLRQLAAATRAL